MTEHMRTHSSLLTVVMPVYNEGAAIYDNVWAVHKVLEGCGQHHNFVCVNDGSKDNSLDELNRLVHDLPCVKAVNFSRNFGKEAALCCGLDYAKMNEACEAVLTIDSDLQHPIEAIPQMIKAWHAGSCVVEGVKASRGKESLAYKFCASSFYKIYSRFSGVNLNQATDFKLLDLQVIKAWSSMEEVRTFYRGMTSWVGFSHTEIPIEIKQRTSGTSSWNFNKLAGYAVDNIVSYSPALLRFSLIAGGLFGLGAVFVAIEAIARKIMGTAADGFTTVILLILILGCLLLFCLGISGLYLSKIYDEVKRRPRYIVDKTVDGTDKR